RQLHRLRPGDLRPGRGRQAHAARSEHQSQRPTGRTHHQHHDSRDRPDPDAVRRARRLASIDTVTDRLPTSTRPERPPANAAARSRGSASAGRAAWSRRNCASIAGPFGVLALALLLAACSGGKPAPAPGTAATPGAVPPTTAAAPRFATGTSEGNA